MTDTPAGWYPDPEDASRHRWWNGVSWTENRSDPAPAYTPAYSATAPAYSADYAAAEPLTAPVGTPWNTVWIWLVIFVPLLPLVGFFMIDWAGMFDFESMSDPSSGGATQSLAYLTSPAYLLSSVGGWVTYGLSVWFAYLDYRTLERRGVPKPFHWAWTFLSSAAYGIGRSVVVRRRTGRGIAPMWVTIATIVLSVVLSIVLVGLMLSTIFSQTGVFTR